MGKNGFTNCDVCKKRMRKDYLKIHIKVHMKEKLKMDNLEQDILKQVYDSKSSYDAQVQCGKKVYELVKKYKLKRRKLNFRLRELLRMYENECIEDLSHIKLQEWQEDLFKKMVPSDRKIIWVVGKKGNEGKTFFQQYAQKKLGRAQCIVGLNPSLLPRDIKHAMNKEFIEDFEYLLFNVPNSIQNIHINYDLFEGIKDGIIVADKFESRVIHLTIPNVVVVFSNSYPDKDRLKPDRWEIYEIIGGKLYKEELIKEINHIHKIKT